LFVYCLSGGDVSRTIREARLASATARARLSTGRNVHWNTITAGREHLGWQRWPQERTGRWLLRRRRSSSYSTEQIGIADDDRSADGSSILTYDQARLKAAELCRLSEDKPAGRITVARAMADYIDNLAAVGKATRHAKSHATSYILPALGKLEVESLTSRQLRKFLADAASSPARRRTGLGKPQRFSLPASSDEEVRRRRSTANRVFAVLRAALNLAYDERRCSSAEAWGRRVKRFRGVDAARVRYLSTDEATRLLNACDPDFRQLVRAALETGMRYGELGRLEVSDFNPDAGTLTVRKSKSGRARHVILTREGAEFFQRLCAGRKGSELLLQQANGEPWRPSNQSRPMAQASQVAKIDPAISFHGLRHTWASLAVMNGVPLMVVARNLGHADTRMTEHHYGHLSQGFIHDAIRAGAPRFTAAPLDNVEPLKVRRNLMAAV
jgi:integrase